MSTSDPKTTVRQQRYIQGNRELIKDPSVVEEFDRIAGFLLGSQSGMGQREVERDLDYGFDRSPTFEWPVTPMDYQGLEILVDVARAAAYAGAYTAVIAMGGDETTAATAGTAAGTAAASQTAGDTQGTNAHAGSLESAPEGEALQRPSEAPTYNYGSTHGSLGPDPGDPAVFEEMLTWVAVPTPGAPLFSCGDIAFCPIENKFILAGRESGAGKVYQSADALNWTELVVPYAVGAGGFVGVEGIDLTVNRGRVVLATINRVYEKDVADVWTELNPTDFLDCTALGYLPGLGFCALTSYLGSPTVQLSTDGYTWVNGSSQPVAGTKIRSGGGYLLRMGTAGVSLSSDGYIWSSVSPGVGFGTAFRDVTYHNSMGVWFGVLGASGASPTRIFKSVNATGEDWGLGTPVYSFGDTGATSILPQSLIYDPVSDKLILSIYYDLFYVSSDGGVTWTAQVPPETSANTQNACVGGGNVVIVSDDYVFVGSVTE